MAIVVDIACSCASPDAERCLHCVLCTEQLYKALEVGYCMGLESLNENLPEIKAEMVFSQKQLQVRRRAWTVVE